MEIKNRKELKRNILSDLIFRDIKNSIDSGDYNYIEDGLIKNNIDISILKDLRSEIFNIEKRITEIKIDKHLSDYFTEDFCIKNKVLPLEKNVLGILDPEQKDVLRSCQEVSIKFNFFSKLIELVFLMKQFAVISVTQSFVNAHFISSVAASVAYPFFLSCFIIP